MNENLEFTYNLGDKFKMPGGENKKKSEEQSNEKFEAIKKQMEATQDARKVPLPTQVSQLDENSTPGGTSFKGAQTQVKHTEGDDDDAIEDEIIEEDNYDEDEFDTEHLPGPQNRTEEKSPDAGIEDFYGNTWAAK